MKKNYIAPSTEMASWASMGLMQAPNIGMSSASGGGVNSSSNIEDID